ncbi:MAG: glycoside hydrolase [Robiginitomaculum sp.]|nr:MAG: glycoside hydrolase [Robiginitomaculum sp.]
MATITAMAQSPSVEAPAPTSSLRLNDKEYFEAPGLNVTVFADYYPDGHQTGVTIIQHGKRVAANGDVRLEISPGQWSPVPKAGERIVDTDANEIRQTMSYPDKGKDRTGFNPIIYPDLDFSYTVRVKPAGGDSFRVSVDLDAPVPSEWVGKIGFNFEFFPPDYFGKAFSIGETTGIFPRQPNGPLQIHAGETLAASLGKGHTLVAGLDDDLVRIKIEAIDNTLELWDGRTNHNNGWFIVRSPLKAGVTKNAVEWLITPHRKKDWAYEPVIQVSQHGYAARQTKRVIIEQASNDTQRHTIVIQRLTEDGPVQVQSAKPELWGDFLRYQYLVHDFSDVTTPGMYQVSYGDKTSHPFKIGDDVFSRHAWQPVLEYYLPVQMCHMRVNEKYRVWHGLDHQDDALMAPVDINHFDGYVQGKSTLTEYTSMTPVPNLNAGGWHDAGDYDLRVESQMTTVWLLSKMVEEFGLNYDTTTIDQVNKITEIHQADGENDAIQQIEHGLLSVLGAYKSMGRLYRGIIVPTNRQYVMLGDAAVQTDGKFQSPKPVSDDRWVFTEDNPNRELGAAAGLAAAARVLKTERPEMSRDALAAAIEITDKALNKSKSTYAKTFALTELFLSTGDTAYADKLVAMQDEIIKEIARTGWVIGMAIDKIEDKDFQKAIREAVKEHQKTINALSAATPYGVPYRPNIWGAGWDIQRFGVQQYFAHKAWPDLASRDPVLSALNFVLGVHPGENTMSFASGVGSSSALVAYGVNRADWSFIPGGVISGTALIRPDLPELREWPFFWQQTEYVMGGGSTNYMFLAMAADSYFGAK